MGCANATMEVAAIVAECERLGLQSIAMTDHMYGLHDMDRHVLIRKDVEKLPPDIGVEVYYALELNFLAIDENFPFSREVKEQYGFQFAIGGIHGTYLEEYDLKKLVDIQHRHHLKVCRDPLVQVLVHPYWFGKGEFDKKGFPWFDSMKAVPESYTRELGQAARQTGTAIEINASANLTNPAHGEDFVKGYVDYLSILADEGATFSVGSDAHDIGSLSAVRAAWAVVEQLGLPADRIWRPRCPPLAGPAGAGC
jgi:histidinol phosphatase-like PHP family hydrolase